MMDMMSKNIIGIVLICLGILILFPAIPRFLIFLLGVYLVYLGIKLIKCPHTPSFHCCLKASCTEKKDNPEQRS
jgi:hypothetical protein